MYLLSEPMHKNEKSVETLTVRPWALKFTEEGTYSVRAVISACVEKRNRGCTAVENPLNLSAEML